MTVREVREGEPCPHPGCLSHRTHPCEGCGRVGGNYSLTCHWLRTQLAWIALDVPQAKDHPDQHEKCWRRKAGKARAALDKTKPGGG